MQQKITLQRLGYKKRKSYSGSYPTYIGIPNGKVQPIVMIKNIDGGRCASFLNMKLSDGAIIPMENVPEFLIYAVANEFQRLNSSEDDE